MRDLMLNGPHILLRFLFLDLLFRNYLRFLLFTHLLIRLVALGLDRIDEFEIVLTERFVRDHLLDLLLGALDVLDGRLVRLLDLINGVSKDVFRSLVIVGTEILHTRFDAPVDVRTQLR